MMDPLYQSYVESDMMHNYAHGLSMFGNLHLSLTKLQKVKHFLQVK
jgi:hypothetical protein